MNIGKKQGLIISFLICLVITAFTVYFMVYLPIRQTKICTQSSKAVISEVEVYDRGMREKYSANYLTSENNHTYRYLYSFTVNGKSYSGYDYKQTQDNWFPRKVGEVVMINYNPENPNVFMLPLGVKDYLLMGLPILSLLFTLVLGKAIIKPK